MNQNKKKGFASKRQPLFDNRDFLRFFQERVSQMVKNEVEQQFRDMLYKY